MGKLLIDNWNVSNGQANNQAGKGGIGVGGLLFVVLIVIKLTEKCSFWNGSFPDWLKSTNRWWDGWFLVFAPLWVPLVVILGICFIVAIFVAIFKN